MNPHEAILLFVISLGAFFIPFVSKRLLLPSAVGELIFGLILGLFFGDYFTGEETGEIVKFMGELGFIILMYLAGLEINFEKIKSTPKKDLFIYSLIVLLIVILSFEITLYFSQNILYALVYLTIGVGLLFSVLKDTRFLKSNLGQTLLIIGSIGEVVSLMFITFFFLYFKYGLTKESLLHLLEIYFFFAFVIVLIKIYKLLVWWYPEIITSIMKKEDASEVGMRANLLNMFIFVAVASIVGLEAIIGAFIGGLLVALIIKDRKEIEKKFSSLGYGFLIPIFFIEVGLRFNLFELLKIEVIKEAVFLTVIIILIRVVASLLLFLTNLSLKEILFVPFGLSMPLTLLVAISTIGLNGGIITEKQASSIILTAILTGSLYPWVFKLLAKKINIFKEKEN